MEKNGYLLTMMIAERAKQLLFAGAKPLVKTKTKNPVTIALEEIKAGKVYLKEKKDPEKEDPFKRVLRFRTEEEDQEPEFNLLIWGKGGK